MNYLTKRACSCGSGGSYEDKVIHGKRKRNDDMDVDEAVDDESAWQDDTMDLDDAASVSGRAGKKAKGNTGVALKNPKLPKKDRSMAGLRDEQVRNLA